MPGVSFDLVTQYLIVLTPGPGSRSGEAEQNKHVLTADDQQDGEKLQVRDQVPNTTEEEGEKFSNLSAHLLNSACVRLGRLNDVRAHLLKGVGG